MMFKEFYDYVTCIHNNDTETFFFIIYNMNPSSIQFLLNIAFLLKLL